MSEPTASKFTDRQGRDWSIALDYTLLQRIKDVAAIDLGNIEQLASVWVTLLYDDLKALGVVWLAIETPAVAAGLTREGFLAAMDGETLAAATAALETAIYSFTPPRKRGMAQAAIAKIQEGMSQAIAKTETLIENVLGEATTRALSALGTSPTASPASSATSTPGGPTPAL